MRFTIGLALVFLVSGCAGPSTGPMIESRPGQSPPIPWASIGEELVRLQADDQLYEMMVIDQDPAIREPGFFALKDDLQIERANRCKEIFRRYGFPGYDKVGEKASGAFWLLVQHADHDPDFQQAVAQAMTKAHRNGHADGANLAYLTDRVRVNTGQHQLYGTQVDHDIETGRVYPKSLESPEGVDERRARVGLEPLRDYLNDHCRLFFDMNAPIMAEHGITAPYQYEVGFNDW